MNGNDTVGNYSGLQSFTTVDGAAIGLFTSYHNCSLDDELGLSGLPPEDSNWQTCADIYIDINGIEPPNQVGRDFFYVELTTNNLALPSQAPYASGWLGFDNCNPLELAPGFSCAQKVLTTGEMNY